jgi:hypothetical protein
MTPTDPAIYGPAGPNGEAPSMTLSQYHQWQLDTLAAAGDATPAPPGFPSYAAWQQSITGVAPSPFGLLAAPAVQPAAPAVPAKPHHTKGHKT